VPGQLQREIQQGKPFARVEVEAFLNLLRSTDRLLRGLVDLLRPRQLSPAQYNVLRILRGAGDAGLSCGAVAERLVAHDPDVTRLLDRLEAAGHVQRARDRRDRRVVTARITASGLELLAELDPEVSALHARQLGHLGPARLRRLVALLELARTPPGDGPEATRRTSRATQRPRPAQRR
jgi:DNA-binding MarR family transcriptional regulator